MPAPAPVTSALVPDRSMVMLMCDPSLQPNWRSDDMAGGEVAGGEVAK
jgi:hypothetical protein